MGFIFYRKKITEKGGSRNAHIFGVSKIFEDNVMLQYMVMLNWKTTGLLLHKSLI